MADRLGISINLRNGAFPASQYSNHPYNSIAVGPNGEMLAAGDDGIHRLWTEDDDNGSLILSRLDTHLIDFGVMNQKRIPALYLYGEGDGSLRIDAFNKEDESRTVWTDRQGDIEDGFRVALGMEKGKFWKFRITNPRGQDFSIDELDALVVVLER